MRMIPAEAVEAAAKAIDGSTAEGCGCCSDPKFTAEDDKRADELNISVRALLIAREALEAAAPHMLEGAVEERDAELDLHLIIKGLRVRNGSATGMMVCSSEDRAQIVQAILAAGYQKAAK